MLNIKISFISIFLLINYVNAFPIEYRSDNYDSRIKYVVIHFTSENLKQSINILTDRDKEVSSHYLISDNPNDDVINLVDEDFRAWHAGDSYWKNNISLNDNSIGIEIVNESKCIKKIPLINNNKDLDEHCSFIDFKDFQIEKLVQLITDIQQRHPRIQDTDIIGHADISPSRKLDPGPKFPWYLLYTKGIGAWYNQEDYEHFYKVFRDDLPSIKNLQIQLLKYGYNIEPTGIEDLQSIKAVRAFQMHFRQSNHNGYFDQETASILYSLNKKYDIN